MTFCGKLVYFWKGNNMKVRFVIVLVCVVLLGSAVLWGKKEPVVAKPSAAGAWEYAVFRIGGNYRYEWQGPEKRIYGETLTIFFEKMRLYSILSDLQGLRDDTQTSLAYVVEGEFLNYLGAEGWELTELTDKGLPRVPNKTFWFKRPKR